MRRAFVINSSDNVATALDNIRPGEAVLLLGAADHSCAAVENINAEHKLALVEIPAGAEVIKFGMLIGRATKDIAPGEWVHLHNCASNYDVRSGTLDNQSGAPTDIEYV